MITFLIRCVGWVSGLAILSWTGLAQAQSPTKFVSIGTGGVTGVYYVTGGAICRFVNRTRNEHGMRCREESSAGSVVNLDSLRRGSVNFALVQADLQFQAFKGQGAYAKTAPQEQLRSVFSTYPEILTVVAAKGTPGANINSLKGRRISLGMQGTGSRATVEAILQKEGWGSGDLQPVAERSPDEQSYAMCEGKIDAYVFVAGHPSSNVMRAVKECQARILGLSPEAIAHMVSLQPYFTASAVPGGVYPDHPEPVQSLGLMATLMTNAEVPEAAVYAVVKAVFDNFEEFKKLHPALSRLDPKTMVKDGLTAPLHPGALRYYKEKGWL